MHENYAPAGSYTHEILTWRTVAKKERKVTDQFIKFPAQYSKARLLMHECPIELMLITFS